jgi:AraC-like DNA-binding protein
MDYLFDAPFADTFLCDGELQFHDYYYIAPEPAQSGSLFYQINRTGIESTSPGLFFVERGAAFPYSEIFCIFSGKGTLKFRNRTYQLDRQQIIVLPPGEPHAYSSDEAAPLGMSWVEFCGGDSARIIRHIADTQGPVIEGSVFSDISSALSLLQQRLMIGETQNLSLEIYRLLLELLENEKRTSMGEISQDIRHNFIRAEAYIDAHLGDRISNRRLAGICGISISYFIRQFREIYRMSPQEYIMARRLRKSRFLLLQTSRSIDQIAESLGFCNTSHFIRRFRKTEGMTPARYRKTYGEAAGQ